MKQGITIQERLKDLRTERHLKLEELAEFYGVSTDYLLCVTENRNPPNAVLTELHLSDDMVELLKSGRINNRPLCEIATHGNFTALMTDAEIYVDGIATMRFQDINATLKAVRTEIQQKYQPEEEDTTLKALQASQIQEEDYFCHVSGTQSSMTSGWITKPMRRVRRTIPTP